MNLRKGRSRLQNARHRRFTVARAPTRSQINGDPRRRTAEPRSHLRKHGQIRPIPRAQYASAATTSFPARVASDCQTPAGGRFNHAPIVFCDAPDGLPETGLNGQV